MMALLVISVVTERCITIPFVFAKRKKSLARFDKFKRTVFVTDLSALHFPVKSVVLSTNS